MCAALPALGLTAKTSGLFFGGLGIKGLQAVAGNRAARQAANYEYEAARLANQSAEQALKNQQTALNQNLKETRAATAQENMAATIRGKQALGSIAATEGISGNLFQLLAMDQQGQTANLRNKNYQTLASKEGQFRRDSLGLVAARDSRRNQSIDMQNRAYARAKQNTTGIFDFLGDATTSYFDLREA